MKLPFFAFLLGLLMYSHDGISQSVTGINYSAANSLYTQNFDGLPSTGSFSIIGKGPINFNTTPINANNLAGWQFLMISGSGANAVLSVGTGSGTGSGMYSFGLTNAADRSLGSLASSTGIYSFGVILTNSTGSTLNTVSIAFLAKQWRKGGSGNKNTWKCLFKTGLINSIDQPALVDEPQLNFNSIQTSTGVATLNGNLTENQVAVNFTIANIQWKSGEQLLIRWDDADETGSDDVMAIDQFNFSARFNTPDPIPVTDIQSLANNPTNADTIQYAIKLGGNTNGLNSSNFQLKANGLMDTKLVSITGSGSDYTATIFTGKGEGYFQLGIVNDNDLLPGLQGLPYFDIDTQWIDKVGPLIQKISIPNQLMKGGDTVPVTIQIFSEKSNCTLFTGHINNYPLQPLKRLSDSVYSSTFILPLTGVDIQANDSIPVSIIIQDSLGNKSNIYNLTIAQNNDPIDFNKPIQILFSSNSDSLLKLGDTLKLTIQFNEPVLLDPDSPTNFIPVTIGSRVKNVVYNSGNNSSSLSFQYIILPGENDKDGIRIASSFSAKNLLIKDLAGNPATLSIPSGPIQHIKIDAIAPLFSQPKDTSIFICASTSPVSINELLRANNIEPDESLTWKLIQSPNHLIISKKEFAFSSTSASILPIDFMLENPTTYNGIDSLIFSLSDGINVVTKKIKITTISIETNNTITGQQQICIGSIPSLLTGTIKLARDSTALFLWEQSTVSDSSSFTPATGKNNEINYQPVALTKTSWWRRKMILSTCTAVSNIVQISISQNSQWIGKISSEWSNPSNWCGNIVPSDTSTVQILTGVNYYPMISSTVALKHIQISKGANLNIIGTLSLSGSINADTAAVNALKGTLLMRGDVLQTIDGNIFEKNTISELQINNSSGVSINNKLSIASSLTMARGMLNTNDQLTIAYKARVGASANGTAINGLVRLEQDFAQFKIGQYLIGHPFSVPISINQIGSTATTKSHSQENNQDSSNLLKVWQPFDLNTLNENNQWKRYQGIQLQITSTTDSIYPSFAGPINHGRQTIQLNKISKNGLNIIANPFASPIQLNTISKTSMVGNHYWIWNPKQGINGGFTTISATQPFILNPFEVFIAEARDQSNHQIIIAEESKAPNWNNGNSLIYQEDNKYNVVIGLYSANQYFDQLVLTDHGNSKNAIDSNDAIKLQNPDANFYSFSSDQHKLSVDARRIDNNSIVPIQIESTEIKHFYLKIQHAFLPSENKLVLHDRYTNQYLPLVKDSVYAFSLHSDSAINKNRFEISQFIPKGNIEQLMQYLTIKLYPNPVINELSIGIKSPVARNTIIQLFNNAGILIKSFNVGNVQAGIIRLPVSDLIAGSYLVNVNNGEHQRTLPFIKQ